MTDHLPEAMFRAAAEAIANAKYPGVSGAPGARPFQPRSYDVRYACAGVAAALRVLAEDRPYVLSRTAIDELADRVEHPAEDGQR